MICALMMEALRCCISTYLHGVTGRSKSSYVHTVLYCYLVPHNGK